MPRSSFSHMDTETSVQPNPITRISILLIALAVLVMSAHIRNRLWQGPFSVWQDASAKSPNKARPNYELGLFYSKKGDYTNAYTYLAKAKQLDANFFEKAMGPAEQVRAMSSPDEAITVYRRMLEANPAEAYVHNNLGTAYHDKGQLVQAEAEFLEAIRLDPTITEAHSNLGYIYYKMGYLDGAVSEYRIAITLSPQDPEPHLKLGIALARMNLLVDSAQELQKVLDLRPNDPQALKFLRQVNQAIKKKYHP